MSEIQLFSLIGESIVPASIAFFATWYRKKGEVGWPISRGRRIGSAVATYSVAIVALPVMTLLVYQSGTDSPASFDSPVLIITGLTAYIAGQAALRYKNARA